MPPGLTELLTWARGIGTRSSALVPLLWLDATAFGATVFAVAQGAERWVLFFLVVLATIAVVGTLFAYFWFMFTAPEHLRSERFVINKMAIERGLTGDSSQGLLPPGGDRRKLPPSDEGGGDNE